ncbi:hypothetical protein WH50_24135 [Pokkaliibacter plantistimulans]|uniref:Tetratricopeptide repeat protein n=1 Tax=Pokkaliibacter plantistimulans TaxID=1635171 RepID=A0ABX5LTJ4_9GAMM|nr:tetratricopeptide repeat protein [Pokkaliibacter plantistimulans]PXF28838.1 hypothetical protein WH50_24135 [Pokkaliibacter plantistimulans]
MDTNNSSERNLEQQKVYIELEKLKLEEKRVLLEGSFSKKYAAPLLGVFGTVIASILALTASNVSNKIKEKEIQIATSQKQQELDRIHFENDRKWKFEAVDFVFKNQQAIFSGSTEKQIAIRNVMIATFPSEVTSPLFEKIKASSTAEAQQVWSDGQEISARADEYISLIANGKKSLISKDFDAAAEDFKQVLETKPNDADALNYTGYSYFRKGEYLTAISYLEQALAISPNHRFANLNLTKAFCAQGKLVDAERRMNIALQNVKDFSHDLVIDGEYQRVCRDIYHPG